MEVKFCNNKTGTFLEKGTCFIVTKFYLMDVLVIGIWTTISLEFMLGLELVFAVFGFGVPDAFSSGVPSNE